MEIYSPTKFIPMTNGQHLLITGASSGIGRVAAQRLERAGHRLTLVCRNQERAREALDWVAPQTTVLLADLADLASVDQLCSSVQSRAEPLDVLVLNAGLQYAGYKQPRWSPQGFELTVAVNHLAHQLLLMRLLPMLLQSTSPRLVITASEVHNPASGGGRVGRPASLGDLSGLNSTTPVPMLDGNSRFDADKAYKDSKLCNMLMGLHTANLHPELPVISWSPGLVIPRASGGFFRESRRANPLGQALFGFVARDLLRITESVDNAGERLVQLVLEHGDSGFRYWSNTLVKPGLHRFEQTEPSAEASDSLKAERLWTLSQERIESVLNS